MPLLLSPPPVGACITQSPAGWSDVCTAAGSARVVDIATSVHRPDPALVPKPQGKDALFNSSFVLVLPVVAAEACPASCMGFFSFATRYARIKVLRPSACCHVRVFKDSVMRYMLSAVKQFQVLKSVVRLDAVSVMNNLMSFKWAPKPLLHQPAMLGDMPSLVETRSEQFDVSTLVYLPRHCPSLYQSMSP